MVLCHTKACKLLSNLSRRNGLVFVVPVSYKGKLGVLADVVVPVDTKLSRHSLEERPKNAKVPGHVVPLSLRPFLVLLLLLFEFLLLQSFG
jgi:hypothetical protein